MCPKENLENRREGRGGRRKTTYSPNTHRPQLLHFAVFFASFFWDYFIQT